MKLFTSTLIFFLSLSSFSQSYFGLSTDNYSGIYSLVNNPANVVNSHFKADIHLASGSVFLGSDYVNLNFSDLTGESDDFDFEEDAETFPTNENNFFYNFDIIGPSFMFNLTKRSSIGVVSRIRGISNINSINGNLAEYFIDDFEDGDDFEFDISNFSVVTHAWAEAGLVYGRILLDKPQHVLTSGINIKLLAGGGGFYFNTPGLNGNYVDASETLTTNGNLNLGQTFDEEDESFEFNDITLGYGLDIGFNYEWHPNRKEADSLRPFQDKYKLKIGVSITDIGNINYKDADVITYDMDANVNTNSFDEDVREFLDNNYGNVTETGEVQLGLPTALNLMIDYRLKNRFLINAQANISLTNSNLLANRIINTFTITPRFETRWFSFMVPVSSRQYGDFAVGTALRLGPFSIGSGTLVTNLLTDTSKTLDIFAGLRIPILRR